MSEHKKISIRNLKVSDMVVGQHVDNIIKSYKVVAGIITSISKSKEVFTYNIRGAMLTRPFGKPLDFSGSLTENEIEVIDQVTCNTIIKLYDLANRQIITGFGHHDLDQTVGKIREMCHKSRLELEEKYAVVEAQ